MQLTVLVDNNTLIDQYLTGEPGLCFYIEDGSDKLLFDLGYSDIFLHNARKMGLDLARVGAVIFSHGHNDHTGGLPHFIQACGSGKRVVAHPLAFCKKREGALDIGSPLRMVAVEAATNLLCSRVPVALSANCWFLGEVPATLPFEPLSPVGEMCLGSRWQPDTLPDDSALVYTGEEGLVVVTGCAHRGVCNTIEHAKRVFGQRRIAAVIGGFHLFERGARAEATATYLQQNQVGALYPCHCTSFAVKAWIDRTLPVHEVGVGLRLHFS